MLTEHGVRACLTLAAAAACAGGRRHAWPRTSVAEVWITTADKWKLLHREPNAVIVSREHAADRRGDGSLEMTVVISSDTLL